MRPALSVAAVLVGLFIGEVPCFADGNTLYMCNSGKVEFDGYLVLQSGSIFSKHVPPAECVLITESEGAMGPAYIGFGFTDSKGQWGGAGRFDKIPDWNTVVDSSFGVGTILQRANRSLSVKHGAANVTIPGLLAFHPIGVSSCSSSTSPTSSSTRTLSPNEKRYGLAGATAVGLNASGLNSTTSGAASSPSACAYPSYTLTVIPYPETREIGLDTQCDPCEAKKEGPRTPQEQKEREQQEDGTIGFVARLPGFNSTPLGKGVVNMMQGETNRQRQEKARRAEIAKGPYQMNWKDLSSFVTSAFGKRGDAPLMANRHIILRGTVSRVQAPKQGEHDVQVFFKDAVTMEKPVQGLPGDYFINPYIGKEDAFGICTSDPSIMSEIFGANYNTAMVGKALEMEGEIQREQTCATASGIQIVLAPQLKVVTPGMALAKGQTWFPALKPVVPATPVSTAPASTPPPRRESVPAESAQPTPARRNAPPRPAAPPPATTPPPAAPVTSASAEPAGVHLSRAPAPTTETPAVPVTTASVTPAPVPRERLSDAQAAPLHDPRIRTVLVQLKTGIPEMRILLTLKQRNRPIQLTGDDRGELENAGASEKLIQAMEHPESIGPEVTPQAAAAARREPRVNRPRQ